MNAYNSTNLFANLPQMISSINDYHKFFFMYAVLCYTTVLNEGVDIHKAYPIMDTYVSQIPAITSAEVLQEYCLNITTDYCNHVIPILQLKSESPIITKCLHYIHDNLYNKITIEDLMKHCNASRRTITRHFAEHYSMTVSECIMTAKLKEAAFLLTDSYFSLIEISNQLAFSSQSHFTVAFKKMYNYTPLQYRKKHR